MIGKEEIKMNYMFSDKYDIRDYLDKKLGVKVTDEIFDIIDKDEEEYKKKRKILKNIVDTQICWKNVQEILILALIR